MDRRTSDFSIDLEAKTATPKMLLKFVLLALLIHMESKAESNEDTSNPFSYSNNYAVTFNDLFSYTHSLVGGETAISPDVKEDEYSLHTMPTQYQLVELNNTPPPKYEQSYPTPPKYAKNPKLLSNVKEDRFRSETTTKTYGKASFESSTLQRVFPSWMTIPKTSSSTTFLPSTSPATSSSSSSTTTTTTTERFEETTQTFLMVSTTRDPSRERGILDLLFPAKRVKSFKTMFVALRNILSHTFRR